MKSIEMDIFLSAVDSFTMSTPFKTASTERQDFPVNVIVMITTRGMAP